MLPQSHGTYCVSVCVDSGLGAQSAQYEKLKRENTRLQAEVERLEKEVLRQKALRCGSCLCLKRHLAPRPSLPSRSRIGHSASCFDDCCQEGLHQQQGSLPYAPCLARQ